MKARGSIRGRLEAVQGERAALEPTRVEPVEIARLLRDDFAAIWRQLSSQTRRRVAQVLVEHVPVKSVPLK
jgi:hypothetical protein